MFCKWCGNKLNKPGAACPVCGRMQGSFQNGNQFYDFPDAKKEAVQPRKKDCPEVKIPVKPQQVQSPVQFKNQKLAEDNISHYPDNTPRKPKTARNKAVAASVASAVAILSLASVFGAFSALKKAEKFEEDLARQDQYLQQSVNQMNQMQDALDYFKKKEDSDANISADLARETTQYTEPSAGIEKEKQNSYEKENPDKASAKVPEVKQENQTKKETVPVSEDDKMAMHPMKPPRLQKRIAEGTSDYFEYVLVGLSPDVSRIDYCWEMISDEDSDWKQLNNNTDTLRVSADNSARYRLICSGEKDVCYTLSDLESGADRQLPFYVYQTRNKGKNAETIYEFERESVESSGCSAFWEKSSDGLNWSSLGDEERCIKTENDHSQYRLHVIFVWNAVFEIPQK